MFNALDEQSPAAVGAGVRTGSVVQPQVAAVPITQVTAGLSTYMPTGIGELDRVLGGGCVPGAAILFSGEPGVGKSTLLLKAAAQVASLGAKVLYISGEESAGQIKLRADRTSSLQHTLFLAAETDVSVALGHVAQIDPDFLIVDSVQTLASPSVDGIAGGPAQVREVASLLVREAKRRNMPLMLVGHVTKDGNIAGPRTLEHLVDVVCHFEGDRNSSLRFLRTLKNRFGATDEVGCFEMAPSGIVEVYDPSSLFVSENSVGVSGTCVAFALEGRRVLPVEVQALVNPSSSPNPRRVTSGVDAARVAMILAVLERRAGLRVHDKDVYVATACGVKLTEPGADLAIALAIMSAASNQPLAAGVAAAAEISLSGEVRKVLNGPQRQKEAQRLGYTRFLDAAARNIAEACKAALKG